jgi:hypothetical protein
MIRNTTRIRKIREPINVKGVKIYLLGGLSITLAVSCIFMSIGFSTSGAEFATLQNKEAELLANKNQLEQLLVQSLAAGKLRDQSMALGFTKVESLVYVANSESVAKVESVAKLPN